MGHEISHMFGCAHNPEIMGDLKGSAYGALVNDTYGRPTKYHTIMA